MNSQKAYTFARLTMVAVALLAIANITWSLLDNNNDFAAVPAIAEILMLIEMALYNDAIVSLSVVALVGLAIAAILAVYIVCGLLAKKQGKWLTVGFVFYAVDYIFRLYLTLLDTYPDNGIVNHPVMLVVRILIPTAILVILIIGMIHKKHIAFPKPKKK